jgi:hypothetical protein
MFGLQVGANNRVGAMGGSPVSPGQIGPRQGGTATPHPVEKLAYGNSIKKTFVAGGGPYLFTFEAQAGDVITLTMVAGAGNAIDPVLVLIGPDGKPIARNDDSLDANFGPTNARLVNFPIPKTGTYTIQAERHAVEIDGEFTLTLRANRARSAAVNIELGQTSRGEITTSNVRASYQFRASQGDLISIAVESVVGSRLAPYVMLLNSGGERLASSDPDASGEKSASIARYLITNDGQYTIAVTRIGEERGTSSGPFSMTLTLDASYLFASYGDTISGSIDNDQFEVSYAFSAQEGDQVTVTMTRTGGNLDASLALLDLDGKQLASNENATGTGLRTGDSRVRFRIPETGSYVIVAGRRNKARGTTTGEYNLMLTVTK